LANGPAFIEGLSISVTISIGVACIGDNIKTQADILATADKALYQAKTNGRNRVELA
jgi:diguanylate cyclase (GGDEF)-like protein